MGFWTDWLVEDPKKAKSGKQTFEPFIGEYRCGVCDYPAKRCKCDPELGRPRRWYE